MPKNKAAPSLYRCNWNRLETILTGTVLLRDSAIYSVRCEMLRFR